MLDIPLNSLLLVADKYGLRGEENKDAESIIDSLRDKRIELRREKKYQLADGIRSDLKELGITLEDTSEGTISRYKKP
jgi:cysteinyl-tRNA synthetase